MTRETFMQAFAKKIAKNIAKSITKSFSWLQARSTAQQWLFVGIWYAAIYVLSALPAASSQNTQQLVGGISILNMLFRMAAHAAVFGMLALLVYAAVPRMTENVFAKTFAAMFVTTFVTTLVIVAVLGFGDEWHQSVVPGRFFRVQDIITDVAGGAVAILLLRLAQKRTGAV
jgi:VanZ family protein